MVVRGVVVITATLVVGIGALILHLSALYVRFSFERKTKQQISRNCFCFQLFTSMEDNQTNC